MTKRSKEVMGMLTGMATKEVDSATEALAFAMKSVQEAQSKYDMLVEYKDDYNQSFQRSMKQGLGLETYQNFQHFFKKLDVAVKGQHELLENAQKQVLLQKKEWRACQRKKISYDVLTQRYSEKEMKHELKKDQLQMDEFAMRKSHGK